MLETFETTFAHRVESNAKVCFLHCHPSPLSFALPAEVFFALNAMTPWMILRMDNVAASTLLFVAIGAVHQPSYSRTLLVTK